MENSYYVPLEPAEIAEVAPDSVTDSEWGAGDFEYLQPTEATVSAWATDIQHGGPPTGLLMRTVAGVAADSGMQFTRVTTDILGPVGLAVNRVRGRVIRSGRQIAMVGAELQVRRSDGRFQTAARSMAWLMRAADTDEVRRSPSGPLRPPPDQLTTGIGVTADSSLGVDWGTTGFIGSTETAVVPGRAGDTPAIWIRPAIDLVAGEPISDLESIMTVVDVANGMGTTLSPAEWTWMNTDTTVHLAAVPRGPWLGIDAEMATASAGFGVTFADLYDVDGFIGRSAQTLLLGRR